MQLVATVLSAVVFWAGLAVSFVGAFGVLVQQWEPLPDPYLGWLARRYVRRGLALAVVGGFASSMVTP